MRHKTLAESNFFEQLLAILSIGLLLHIVLLYI